MVRSLDPEGASSNLARVIMKDVGLASHILRVGNSMMYNRSGKPIISIAHAITMLGWDAVRNLVGALRFVEHFAQTSPGLRELLMFSLLSATHGRQVAAAVGYPRPEDAYVCGLFRNLGEIVLARYYGLEYAEMLRIMNEERITMTAAAFRIFDFSPDEIAQRLASAWNLPSPVRLCIAGEAAAMSAEERCLVSATGYGHELTFALYRCGAPFESVHLKTVVDASGRPCLISQRDLRRLVNCAVEDTQHTFKALQIPLGSLNLGRQSEQARQILDATSPPVPYDLDALDAAIQEAAKQTETQNFDVTQVIQSILDALVTHAGFERALFALMSDDRTSVRGRLGSGPSAEAAMRQFRFSLLRSDAALNATVGRKTDLWIYRLTDSRYDASRLISGFKPSHFALFPIVADDVVAGLIFAERRTLQVPDDIRQRFAQARDVIATAIGKKRLTTE